MKQKYCLGLLVLVTAMLAACGGGGSSPGGPGPDAGVSDAVKKIWNSSAVYTHTARNVKQTTAKGVSVWSRRGLSQEFLTQADEALTELFADVEAAFPGQVAPISVAFGNYDIYEPDHDCTPSPVSGVPGFYIKDQSLQYDGTQWDQYDGKDGKSVVMAAERIFGLTTLGSTFEGGPPRAAMLVCPDLSIWKNGVRYGAEHNVAESSLPGQGGNSALFEVALANRVHTTGGHPFIPSRAAGLRAQPKQDLSKDFAPLPVVVK